MDAVIQPDQRTLTLTFGDLDGVRSFIAEARRQNGFLVTLERELKLFESYTVALAVGTDFDFRFEAQVIQVFPGAPGQHPTAFQAGAWPPSKEAELARKLAAGAEAATAPADTSPTLGTSPLFQIKDLNVSARMRLAARADRTERQILLRDSSPQVHLGLLANPRIEDAEVLELVRSTQSTTGVLERVAKNRKWMLNYEIQLALVRNPKTPPPVAIQLLELLRTRDLGDLAKSPAIRESVKKAALRLYLKRSAAR